VTGGRSGSRRSSSPHATAQRFLLPRPYFGGFGKPALDRAAVKADVTELAVVEAAEQRKAGLARALFNESRYRAIDDAAGARKEICDCRSDRARSRSIASSMIQQRHGGHPSRGVTSPFSACTMPLLAVQDFQETMIFHRDGLEIV